MDIKRSVCLKDKIWFRTGGNAVYFCVAASERDFAVAADFSLKNSLKFFVFGGGANTLICDDGFDGLVIKSGLNFLYQDKDKNRIVAGAGVKIQSLIDYSLEKGFIGLEEFSGIPGTVGGAVFMNIHYMGRFLGDYLVGAKVLDVQKNTLLTVDKSWFNFGYDDSRLHMKKHILVQASFQLSRGDSLMVCNAKARRDNIIQNRNARYPCRNTCGCFFKNFNDEEIDFLVDGKKIVSAAHYLEIAGARRGLSSGCATVSKKHSNMIVTRPGATSEDVIDVAIKMQELVLHRFGILLRPECELIGFKEYPLMC
jgi:UDP-N-acetylmuramate dehydrogenase